MAKKHLKRTPTHLAPECWYYEEPKGLYIVVEQQAAGISVKTSSYLIPWRSIRAALKRKDRKD